MIELNKEKYYLLIDSLQSADINTLFARTVIEGKVKGKVFVDNVAAPTSFYIGHPYGMSLLFGETDNDTFNQWLVRYALNHRKERNYYEWMQAYPPKWDEKLQELFKNKIVKPNNNIDDEQNGIIELNTRVNFKFNISKFRTYKKEDLNKNYHIIRTNAVIYNEMEGSVIPSKFWNSAEDFCKRGVGFSLFDEGNLAATGYSAFIFETELELGIETVAAYRGNGYAQHVCAALIDYCVENNYEPIWACKYENTASYRLAQKLGFEPILYLPYYRLSL